jgi:hypothetical protein
MALLDNVASLVYSAANGIGGTTWDITLKKAGSATVDAYGGTTPGATTDATGRGFIEDYTATARQMGGIPITDRKITIFAASMSASPEVGDTVTAESADYQIITVQRDPAAATWVCQAR